MKSLILILLYLCKDTLYRWRTRPSSPLARLLVVGFLSLSALVFLSNYILSAKILEQEISRNGGNLLILVDNFFPENAVDGEFTPLLPLTSEEYKALVFNEFFSMAKVGQEHYSLVEYPVSSTHAFKELGLLDNAIYVLPRTPTQVIMPINITLQGHELTGVTLPQQKAGSLAKVYQSGAIFIPSGLLPQLKQQGFMKKYIIEVKEMKSSLLQSLEDRLNQIVRLDKRSAYLQSSKRLLEELEKVRESQRHYRLGISLGISLIVGILLTAISSMEFRENEYVYALMSSFGVQRLLLIVIFIVENLVLSFLALGAALYAVMEIQPFLTRELFKAQGVGVSLEELFFDVRILSFALIICVLFSTLPIIFSAYRPIGRVLK